MRTLLFLASTFILMAGFGNKKAYDLMTNEYKSSWTEYPTILNEIIKENKSDSKQ